MAELRLCESDSKNKFLCLGGLPPVSLRGIMEGSSSSSSSLCVILLPLSFSLLSSLLLPPSLGGRRGGSPRSDWFYWRRFSCGGCFSMLCLIKMDQRIALAGAALFSISLKRQLLMRTGASLSVREELCWVTHLWTVFYTESTWVTVMLLLRMNFSEYVLLLWRTCPRVRVSKVQQSNICHDEWRRLHSTAEKGLAAMWLRWQ